MQMNILDAKTNLSKLIEAACAGEDVVIAKGGKPVARLVPIAAGGFRFGVLDGQIDSVPDFLSPMDEDALAAWEGAGG